MGVALLLYLVGDRPNVQLQPPTKKKKKKGIKFCRGIGFAFFLKTYYLLSCERRRTFFKILRQNILYRAREREWFFTFNFCTTRCLFLSRCNARAVSFCIYMYTRSSRMGRLNCSRSALHGSSERRKNKF